MIKDRYDFEQIDRAIKLITLPGHVYELRTVGNGLYGYFDTPEKLAYAAKKVSGTAGVSGVYLTINPTKPELLARTGGKDVFGTKNGGTTSDKDILRRAAVVIDIDSAIRASGISATDEEKLSSIELAQDVKKYLLDEGFPYPLFADSGNGYHLRYNIDLPNDQESRDLIDRFLRSLAQRFNDGKNKIDTTLSNASRICKLYGTLSAKGADMPDRPHRINQILEDGSQEIVSLELLKKIADLAVTETRFDGTPIKTNVNGLVLSAVPVIRHNWKTDEMEAILEAYGIEYHKMEWRGGWKYQINCVFNPDHHSPDAYTLLMPDQNGRFYPVYKCSHDSCSEPRWKAFISKLKNEQPEIKVELFENTTGELTSELEIDEFYEENLTKYKIPNLEDDTNLGDYLGDLSHSLTDGTFIPLGFCRATLKAIVGSVLDDKVGFPGEEFIHMRHWNALVSARPEAGKGEIWKRLSQILHEPVIKTYNIELPKAGFFSSGEHAIKTLAQRDGTGPNDPGRHLAYFDEMKGLFEKGSSANSTLFSRLLELYEQKSGGVGSLTHNTASFENVSLSMTGGFTLFGFENSISGKGVGGDGFLSRMVLEYSGGIEFEGDWKPIDSQKTNLALKNIRESLQFIYQYNEDHKSEAIPRFIPIEDEDARIERLEFQKWLNLQKKQIELETPGASYASRIESHFKRDLLCRVVFSPDKRITKSLVIKSINWAKHQLILRQALWPIDRGNDIEKAEKRIMKAIREHGPLSKPMIQLYSDAETHGFNSWNPAWKNILQAGVLVLAQYKNTKKMDMFTLRDKVWVNNKWEIL